MNQALTQVPAVPLHIGGKHHASSTTEWRDVVNPATQEIVARVPFSTPDEVNLAVATAKEAFKTMDATACNLVKK